jgi:hypothetical protein
MRLKKNFNNYWAVVILEKAVIKDLSRDNHGRKPSAK